MTLLSIENKALPAKVFRKSFHLRRRKICRTWGVFTGRTSRSSRSVRLWRCGRAHLAVMAAGAILGLLTIALSGPTLRREPRDLAQGADCVSWMMSRSILRRSAFTAAYPHGKPSQYVAYLFSDMGVNDWPYRETEAPEGSMEWEQARAIGMPLLPDGVRFVPRELDRDLGRQIVMRYDDSRNVVILEGYEDPSEGPAMEREFELRLPAIRPEEKRFADLVRQENEDLGASSASFDSWPAEPDPALWGE